MIDRFNTLCNLAFVVAFGAGAVAIAVSLTSPAAMVAAACFGALALGFLLT